MATSEAECLEALEFIKSLTSCKISKELKEGLFRRIDVLSLVFRHMKAEIESLRKEKDALVNITSSQTPMPYSQAVKKGPVMRWVALILKTIFISAVASQRTLFDVIQKINLQKGVPFRENIYLDDLPILPEYDFVVVGSGPAGSAIANRLTEQPDWTVLLIEKGLEANMFNEFPPLHPYSVLGNFSRTYSGEKEPGVCTGLVDGVCHWPSGNGVGGATLINGMFWTRGHPSDYDRWADDGNPGWSFEEVLPYFLKSENMSISSLANSKYHSKNGPVHIEYTFLSDIAKRFLKAAQELGYDLVDYNNPKTTIGFSRSQVTTKSGKRHSAATAYLLPIRKRNNLHIVKATLVTKILIDPGTKRAFGVKFTRRNKDRVVLAKKEIILSAGAFGSPQLLMLSGIGPRDHLKKMNISIIQDLPVGNNLQEHVGTPGLSFLINSTESLTLPKLLINMPKTFMDWMEGKGGVLTSIGVEVVGFIKTPLSVDDKPDVELLLLSTQPAFDGGLVGKTEFISDGIYDNTWRVNNFREGFWIVPMVMYPRSRGVIRLKSTDPRDDLSIDGNFFTDPYDIKVLIEGVRAAIEVAKTKVLREVGAKLHDIPVPGCEMHTFNSDAYWECTIRRIPCQMRHQCGTCRMGPNPESAVVDPRLRVHGVERLRVADASIMPYIPALHTMAPCYMIGEKAADMIKEDWNVIQR